MKLKRTPAFLLTGGLQMTPRGLSKWIERNLEQGRIMLGPLLIFVVATALPLISFLVARRWIGAGARREKRRVENGNGPLTRPLAKRKVIMKKQIFITLGVLALTMTWQSTSLAADNEKTIIGEGQCAKCALHETKSCQNAITVDENGKKVTYYLADNKVSKDFHEHICKTTAKVKATGTVTEAHGKLELTPTKIELVKG